MTDNVDKATRSKIMSKIKSKNTKPEQWMESLLKKSRIHFIRHDNNLPGKPDFFIQIKNNDDAVIMVDGCFWHCCQDHWKMPKSNRVFWATKFKNNIRRDAGNNEALLELGFKVIRVWECSLKQDANFVMRRIMKILTNKIRKVYYVQNKKPANPPATVGQLSRCP